MNKCNKFSCILQVSNPVTSELSELILVGVEVGLGVRDAVHSRHGRALSPAQHTGLHLWKISGMRRNTKSLHNANSI